MRSFLPASLILITLNSFAWSVLAEESSEPSTTDVRIMNALDGWDWFETHRREADPVLAKLDPYLAREWWQRERPEEELYPGRGKLRLDTGIEVDANGMTPVSIIMFEADTWVQVAPLLLPNGTATLYPQRRPSQTAASVATAEAENEAPGKSRPSESADPPRPLPSGAGIDDLVMVPPQRKEVPINTGPLEIPSAQPVGEVELGPMSVPLDLGGGYLVAATVSIDAVYRIAAHPAVKAVVQRFPGQNSISFDVGTRTTQGVETHKTNIARSMFPSVLGTGASVVVISDGVTNFEELERSDDLPDSLSLIPCMGGQATLGAGVEGGAMLEIIHDVAPNAQLGFISLLTDLPEIEVFHPDHMARVIDCAAAANPTIIVDDVAQLIFEPQSENGPVQDAIERFVAQGGIYVTSAGNAGNKASGGNRVWLGQFSPFQSVKDDLLPGSIGPGVTIDLPDGLGPGDLWRVEDGPAAVLLTIGAPAATGGDEYVLAVSNSTALPPRPLAEGGPQDVTIRQSPPGICTLLPRSVEGRCNNIRYQPVSTGQYFTVFKRPDRPDLFVYLEMQRTIERNRDGSVRQERGAMTPSTIAEIGRWKGLADVLTVGAVDVAPRCGSLGTSCAPFNGGETAPDYSSDGPAFRLPMMAIAKPDLSAATGVRTTTFRARLPVGFEGTSSSAAEVAGELALVASAMAAACRSPITNGGVQNALLAAAIGGRPAPARAPISDVLASVTAVFDGAQIVDLDQDSVGDACDLCPPTVVRPAGTRDPEQTDRDRDGIGDACDICPGVPNQRDAFGAQTNPCGAASAAGGPRAAETIAPAASGQGFVDPTQVIPNPTPGPDMDGDNLGDIVEPLYGTDPMNADSDYDGIDDAIELEGDDGIIGTFDDGDPLVSRVDSDEDGTRDVFDNCPFSPNPGQENRGGLNVGPLSIDSIGDACQCGDVSGNGAVRAGDAEIVRQVMVGLPMSELLAPLVNPQLCNVFGAPDNSPSANGLTADCTLADVVVTQRATIGLGPGIAPVCAPAVVP